jgi:hypothetical protein
VAPATAEAKPEPSAAPAASAKGSLLGLDDKAVEDKGKPGQSSAVEVEIKLPDGVEIDAPLLEAFKGWAQESGVNSAQASKLAQVFAEHQAQQSRAAQETMDQIGEGWANQIRTDPQLGGKNLAASTAAATRGIEWAGGRELRLELTKLGLGNHPGLFRAFKKLGDALADDKSNIRGGGQAVRPSREQVLDAMYPTMNADGSPKMKPAGSP